MAIQVERRLPLHEFLLLPEEKPALELGPDGVVQQKMSPKARHSAIQASLVLSINAFALPRRLAFAFTELRTTFGGASYVPDVAVLSWSRIPRDQDGRLLDDVLVPPDAAFEIVSPQQSVTALVRKSVWYVANGVGTAFVVDPDDLTILAFSPEAETRVLQHADVLPLQTLLPGLELTVDQVFAALIDEPTPGGETT